MQANKPIKKYDTYKDSGIEWIGEIPNNWNIVQVKNLFNIGRGRVISQLELDDNGEYPVYSSQTQNNGCLGYIKTYDFDTSQLTWTTDGANAGTVFLREGKYNCTNVCGTLQPKSNNINLKYMLYNLVHTAHYHKRQDTNGYKIMNNEMAAIKLCVPILSEQQAIADYLDKKCGEIDRVVESEKKIIEKLKEYKQSVITEAVTKGLDKSAPLKDSGIEWIGEIPKEWEVGRIKYNYYLKGRIGWQGLKANEFLDDGAYLVTGTDFCNGHVNWDTCYHISEERYNEAPEIHVKIDDLLVTKDGTVGKIAYIDSKPEKVSLNSHLLIVRPINENYKNKFMYWVIQSEIFLKYYQLSQNGTIMASLSQEKISNFSFALPDQEIQIKIADYLDKKCSEIDKLISDKEILIEKLTEYKKSLIYECVTGKRKVI